MKSSEKPFQSPRRTSRSPSTMRRVTAMISVIAMLAVASVSTSGVLVRMMPFDRAYGTSRLL